jgi:hypothetical protein
MRKRLVVAATLLVICFYFYACRREEAAIRKNYSSYTTSIVPEPLARKIAQRIPRNYFKTNTPEPAATRSSEFPLYERKIGMSFIIRDEKDSAALYVYNYSDSGFVVISAELQHEPICAYVEKGKIVEYDSVPSMLVEWFSKTVEHIRFLREGAYDNKERAKLAWWQLISETDLSAYPGVEKIKPEDPPGDCNTGWKTTVVPPLLPVTWGQSCSYNDLCPDRNCKLNCAGQRQAYTGCIATAMAQLVRYWQPQNAYNYNYLSMPTDIGNYEVQRLMRDAGRDVSTIYTCAGSAADCARIPVALKGSAGYPDYLPGFGFTSADKANYTAGSYITVKDNLSKGWPVILDGCAAKKKVWLFFWKYDGCHDWICDGFQSSQNDCYGYLWFHMNWGWHETSATNDFNGWYTFNDWIIPGANLNFQYAKDYIYNVHL